MANSNASQMIFLFSILFWDTLVNCCKSVYISEFNLKKSMSLV